MNKPTVSQKALNQLKRIALAASPPPAAPKRDNTFSQSRDTREDRATRQVKTTHKPQTFPHAAK